MTTSTKVTIGFLAVLCLSIVIVIILTITTSLTPSSSPSSQQTTPTVTITIAPPKETRSNPPGIQQSEEYIQSVNQIREQEKESSDQSIAVGQLIDFTPYRGNNFTFTHSYQTGRFTLVVDSENRSNGLTEFDVFLQSHNVAQREWIENLDIIYR